MSAGRYFRIQQEITELKECAAKEKPEIVLSAPVQGEPSQFRSDIFEQTPPVPVKVRSGKSVADNFRLNCSSLLDFPLLKLFN